jgi:hypothetical protein
MPSKTGLHNFIRQNATHYECRYDRWEETEGIDRKGPGDKEARKNICQIVKIGPLFPARRKGIKMDD